MTPDRPYSPQFEEYYWLGGADEKNYVFLQANNVPARFATAQAFTIAELGLGTGLTALLALHLWQQTAAPNAHLSYISYELYPLPLAELQTIHAAFPPHLQPLAMQLQAVYNPQPGWNIWPLGNATLHVYVGDAATGIATQPQSADCWFLDGFSPARNPALWQAELLQRVYALTVPGGTASTYSAAGVVKAALTDAGFHISRVPGYPPKRHMLTAVRA